MSSSAIATRSSSEIIFAALIWTAWLLAQPFGRWLVGAMGIVVLITIFGARLFAGCVMAAAPLA